MATVHFARLVGPSGFSRIVAAKRLLPHIVKDRDFTAMLMDEARLAARIRHPNVVSTLDVVSAGEELIVVMDYVHGESLSRLTRTADDLGTPLTAALAGSIIIDALHGLHAAHEVKDEHGNLLGVVHRDVSPQNLLVGVDGVTRIADFGIAKAAGRSYETRDGTIKGKLSYMAPEQIELGELSRATDVFAVSVVLWELLTGQNLFDGDTDAQIMHRVLTCNVVAPSSFAPDLPKAFDDIVLKGLSRDSRERFQTAREMALALEAVTAPVRASEIGAWVERVASDTLAKRTRAISKIERSLPEASSPVTATKPGTPPARAADDIGSGTGAKVSWTHPGAGRTSNRVWVAAVATLLAVSGALWLWRARAQAPLGSAATSATMAAPVETQAAQVVVSPSAQANAAATPAASAPLAASGAVVGSAPSASAAAVVGARSRPSTPPHHAEPGTRSAPKPAANCDPPYSIDSSGRRIFKLECM
jgi:serine/threonine-protein kinase